MVKRLTKDEKMKKLKNMIIMDMNIMEPKNDIDRVKIKSYCLYLITDVSHSKSKFEISIRKYRSNLAAAYPIKKNTILDKYTMSTFVHFNTVYGKDLIDIIYEDCDAVSKIVYDMESVKELIVKDIDNILRVNRIKNCTININTTKEFIASVLLNKKFGKSININGIRCRDTGDFRNFTRQFLYNSMVHRPYYGNPDLNAFVLLLRVLKGVIYDR